MVAEKLLLKNILVSCTLVGQELREGDGEAEVRGQQPGQGFKSSDSSRSTQLILIRPHLDFMLITI